MNRPRMRHETTTKAQRTVTPNCCNDNGLGAALDSTMETQPTEPGLYYFASGETNDQWEVLRVDYPLGFRELLTPEAFGLWRGDARPAVLHVLCPYLGMTRLAVYHGGLTNPRWMRAAADDEQTAQEWIGGLCPPHGYPSRPPRVVQGGRQS